MSSELNGETPTFENVARLIAKEEDDIEWLADALRLWIWPQERWPQSEQKYGSGLGMFADMARIRWPRARLLKALRETLPDAANTLSEMLADFALFQYLTAEVLGPGFGPLERVTLGKLLHEIRRRCSEASRFSELASEDGKAKAGRSRVLAPQQIDEKVACASTVAVAWKFTRGKPPGPQVRRATRAADLLFALGMAPAGRFDLVQRRRGWGKEPLNAWPPYFKAALIANPMLDRWNEMFAGTLKVVRAHHAGAAGSQTAPTKQNEIPPGNDPI